MDPVMIQIGPLAIRWYGFLIALSVLIGSLWAARLAVRRGLDADKLFNMAPYLVIAGLVGARLVYVVTSPEAFFGPGGDLLDIVRIWKGGVSIHGGVAGVMVAAWICRGINMWSCLDVMTPLGALGIMGGAHRQLHERYRQRGSADRLDRRFHLARGRYAYPWRFRSRRVWRCPVALLSPHLQQRTDG